MLISIPFARETEDEDIRFDGHVFQIHKVVPNDANVEKYIPYASNKRDLIIIPLRKNNSGNFVPAMSTSNPHITDLNKAITVQTSDNKWAVDIINIDNPFDISDQNFQYIGIKVA